MSGITTLYVAMSEVERQAWLAAAHGDLMAHWARGVLNEAAGQFAAETPADLASTLDDAASKWAAKGFQENAKRLKAMATECRKMTGRSDPPAPADGAA